MWCPKPRGKVIRRPKPSLKLRTRAPPPAGATGAGAAGAAGQPKSKGDPHRDKRYFGFKHSDITRIYFVDSTNSVRDLPTGPFQKKQTDITAYLEHAIPSHATQPTAPSLPPPQPIRAQGRRNDSDNIKVPSPCRLPPPCPNPNRALRRDLTPTATAGGAAAPGGGAAATAAGQQNENIRPTTAPTGEMRRLSAANAGHTPGPTSGRSGTGTGTGTGTAGSRRTGGSKPGSVQTGSRPGTRDSGVAGSSLQGSSTRGSGLGSLQCSSRLMSGTSCAFGSRLQSVPE